MAAAHMETDLACVPALLVPVSNRANPNFLSPQTKMAFGKSFFVDQIEIDILHNL